MKMIDWVKLLLIGLVLVGIYYTTFVWLVVKDWSREDYTYGYLIPFVVLYLIWEKRNEIFAIPAKPTWVGISILIPGIILFWLGELSGEFSSLYFSFWLILVSLCWINLGWEKLRAILFPLIIVLAMFPPPIFLHNSITFKLKLMSSQVGVYLMQLYGMSAYREGNIIDLGFTQLQVVDACSGLRFLFPLFVLGLLLSYFFKAAFWKRAILVISTIPITIITNSLRIALTGILSEIWGPEVAEGFFHGFSGWFIFMFALGVMLLEMWVLGRLGGRKPEAGKQKNEKLAPPVESSKGGSQEAIFIGAGRLQAEEDFDPTKAFYGPTHIDDQNLFREIPLREELSEFHQDDKTGPEGLKSFFHPPQFVVAVILLGLTLLLSQGIEFREKIPIAKSFGQFPDQVGEWTGKSQAMEQLIIDTLDLSDYIMINFSNRSGKWVNFYTAYYESQRKGESIHSPATCLPGSGWEFKEDGGKKISIPGHKNKTIPVNRALMIKSGYSQLSYYWFPQRDRILNNAYQLKLYNFWDALTRQRTDGALVRVITPVYDNEKLADAEDRLQSFTQAIVPVLDEFLPK